MPAISQIMTANPQAADARDSLQTVAQAMEAGDFGSMPVLENGRFAGVVTDRDIAVRGVAQGLASETAISEVMSAEPVCVGPDCDLSEAARLMQDKQIRRLYVTDNDALVGVAALADVVGAAGDRLSGETIEEISKG
ncbi:MAG TPA: CBS domain-containing protein [Qipengyuania sp.]|nr:CBS domain-containing protein [Qipengyuania sp.]